MRCLPLPKEEFLWHSPRRSRMPRKNQLACFCETCDACETGGVYCTVTILPLCTSRLVNVTPKSVKGWRQRFRFCHTIPPVLVGSVSLFDRALVSRSFEKGMGHCRTGKLLPARAMKFSTYEMVPAQRISRGEIHICRQLHPKDGARLQYHTFVHIAIVTFAASLNLHLSRQLRRKKKHFSYSVRLWRIKRSLRPPIPISEGRP